MLGQRRLLYHRGVDDQAGTYISDYVLSSVSFLCAVCLAALIIGTKQAAKRWSPSPRPIPTTTCAVVLLLTFLGVLTLLGGLVHQYLQTVSAVFLKLLKSGLVLVGGVYTTGGRFLPKRSTKVTLLIMTFYNSENSIRVIIRSFCHPLFCHSNVVKYTMSSSLLQG